MENLHHSLSIICDTILVSFFIWHSCVRTRRMTREIHKIRVATKNCPYKKIKRVK